jgi:hypothetical protein
MFMESLVKNTHNYDIGRAFLIEPIVAKSSSAAKIVTCVIVPFGYEYF